jgi:hypothetical protein
MLGDPAHAPAVVAVRAIRARWAHTAVVSAAGRFLCFFLFLGYGYFDSLHAYVSLLLLPLFLLRLWGVRRGALWLVVVVPSLRWDSWRIAAMPAVLYHVIDAFCRIRSLLCVAASQYSSVSWLCSRSPCSPWLAAGNAEIDDGFWVGFDNGNPAEAVTLLS